MELDWTHALAVLIGFGLGGLAAWLGTGRAGGGREARRTEQEFREYRDKVARHFAETARLVNDLTDRYQSVFEQLQEGADDLVDPETLGELVGEQDGRTITLQRLGHRPAPDAGPAKEDSGERETGGSPASGKAPRSKSSAAAGAKSASADHGGKPGAQESGGGTTTDSATDATAEAGDSPGDTIARDDGADGEAQESGKDRETR